MYNKKNKSVGWDKNIIMKLKFFCVLVLLIFPMFGIGGVVLEPVKNHSLDVIACVRVNVYQDGMKQTLNKTLSTKISNTFDDVIENAREMPAFGVALHNETIESMKKGVWVEFCFDNLKSHGGMIYERLLVGVQRDIYGFNIIRFYDGQYDGRCFYFDLEDAFYMNKLYDEIMFFLEN